MIISFRSFLIKFFSIQSNHAPFWHFHRHVTTFPLHVSHLAGKFIKYCKQNWFSFCFGMVWLLQTRLTLLLVLFIVSIFFHLVKLSVVKFIDLWTVDTISSFLLASSRNIAKFICVFWLCRTPACCRGYSRIHVFTSMPAHIYIKLITKLYILYMICASTICTRSHNTTHIQRKLGKTVNIRW